MDLNLPYPVNWDQGKAKFNKTTNKLILTMPVIPPPKAESYSATQNDPVLEQHNNARTPLIEVLPQATKNAGNKKKRRRKNKRKNNSAVSLESETMTSDSDQGQRTEEKSKGNDAHNSPSIPIKMWKSNTSKLIVPKAK